MEIPKGRGVHNYGILRAWGVTHSGISEAKGGVKTWKPSVVGYGYFLELPITERNSVTGASGGYDDHMSDD